MRVVLQMLCCWLAVSGLSVKAQEPPKADVSREQIELQLEYHQQRLKILNETLDYKKALLATAVDQARLEVRSSETEMEALHAVVEQRAAELEFGKRNFERTKKLHESGVVTQTQFEEAQHNLEQAIAQHRSAVIEVEKKKQAVQFSELAVKRLQLEGAIEERQVQLEILEAEFHIKELKLRLAKLQS